ncbi:hypothetical protein T08_6132 [Trichinella sp. T8]|nr:hypothetical protein T08_6132 [Trichinella sp. T8]
MNNLQKLQQHVIELASHVDQLHEVIFTDLDGVPILRCSIDNSAEMSIKTQFLASKALSTEKVCVRTVGGAADTDRANEIFPAENEDEDTEATIVVGGCQGCVRVCIVVDPCFRLSNKSFLVPKNPGSNDNSTPTTLYVIKKE